MPILSISGPEAVRIRKANEFSHWGNRQSENRVEPIARPAFDVPFKLKKREKIFTIGSCFARHVERELIERGYRVPVRDLFRSPEFNDLGEEIVNNFGTPSIYNELAWAFGEETFDEASGFVELGKDKFVDLHMINSVKPAPLEVLRARRAALFAATRKLAECRVVIMTLGLVELWWDELAKTYLNTAPMPSALKAAPLRFSLHVLSFDECLDYLQRAIGIIHANGMKDVRIVLTVSPVPMAATHRSTDVMTANCYSKSVLRTVAEHIVTTDESVTYFPSYETVTLSDRRASWDDDLVHVRRDMVAFNVERMVNAFSDKGGQSGILAPDAMETGESGDALLLAERARGARANQDTAFFDRYADQAETSPSFALEYARFCRDADDTGKALKLIEGNGLPEANMLRAELLYSIEDYAGADKAARRVASAEPKSLRQWQMMLDCAVKTDNFDRIVEIEEYWHRAAPRNRTMASAYAARAMVQLERFEEARDRLGNLFEKDAELPFFAQMNYVMSLIETGELGLAANILSGIAPDKEWQVKRVTKLNSRLKALQKTQRRSASN